MSKFKRGDILRNRWAGEKNPTRFFIVWKTYGKKVSVIELINNKLNFEKDSYTDVYELFHDGEPAFVKIGHTRAFELMREDLKMFLQVEELEQ